MVKMINNTNINSILKENGITLIDFWADWCGPCKVLNPIIDKIAINNEEILIGKVNVDDDSELSSKYAVRNIPTLIFFKNGEVVDRLVGISSESEIQKVINRVK